MVLRALAVFVLVPTLATAQQNPQPGLMGSVSGHVTFASTNAPVRLAEVALQPVDMKSGNRGPDLAIQIKQTLLDGSFQISGLAPGSYYVVVRYPGYYSPFSAFTPAELADPTPEVQQRIDAQLPVVLVAANGNASIEIQVTPGASVSGKLVFDDGSPYSQGEVKLLHRVAGRWQQVSRVSVSRVSAFANARGEFEISGLPAGEYALSVTIQALVGVTSRALGPSSTTTHSTSWLNFYSGDTARERDVKPFKLEDGQTLSGQDIRIPVSNLHTLSGSVVEEQSGREINRASVELENADDKSVVSAAYIDPDTQGYQFSFVPDGEYVLKVTGASDVRRETVPQAPAGMPHAKDTVLRTYTQKQPQPLVLHGDIQGVILTVVPASASGATGH
jgi:hypothetical protein